MIRLPGLLEVQDLVHQLGMPAGDLDARVDADEVGSVQERHVEHVALDPLAAVEQPTELTDGAARPHVDDRLERMAGTHLIRDRADAADPGRDVDGFVESAATQEGLEEPWRLVDLEPDVVDVPVGHGDVHRPFPFDPSAASGRAD